MSPLPNPFSNPRLLEAGDGEWVLADDLEFSLVVGAGDIKLRVPSGFTTDFASVPRILWSIFPPFGKWQRAAILHDFLYSKQGQCSRYLADAFFLEGMAKLGVPFWRRVLMYLAVRTFGMFAWRVR